MTTDLAVCSKALVLCGSASITSFDAQTQESQLASALYAVTRDSVMASWDWWWCRRQTTLTTGELAATPVSDWDYAFTLPTDLLRVLSVGGDEDSGADGLGLEYDLQDGLLLVDEPAPIVVSHIYRKAEASWPTWFELAMAWALAAEMVLPLTESAAREQRVIARAEAAMRKAHKIDSDSQNGNPYDRYNGPSLRDVRST